MRYVTMTTFWVVLATLGVVTLVGEFALLRMGYGALSLLVVVATGGAGLVFVAVVSRPAPVTVVETAPVAPATEEEPFDDPVEAADRADSAPPVEVASPPPDPAPVPPVAETVDDGLE